MVVAFFVKSAPSRSRHKCDSWRRKAARPALHDARLRPSFVFSISQNEAVAQLSYFNILYLVIMRKDTKDEST